MSNNIISQVFIDLHILLYNIFNKLFYFILVENTI